MPRLLMLLIGLGFIGTAILKRPLSKQEKAKREVDRLQALVKLRTSMSQHAEEELQAATEALQEAESKYQEASRQAT